MRMEPMIWVDDQNHMFLFQNVDHYLETAIVSFGFHVVSIDAE